MKLAREVRCYLTDSADPPDSRNSWAGWPISDGLAPYVVLRAELDGPIDPRTGYVCNINLIDAMLRDVAAPAFHKAIQSASAGSAALATIAAFHRVAAAVPTPTRLASLTLQTSPHLSFAVKREDPTTMWLTESFEFSASHRLYNPAISDADNARVFGKCANPNGHGHNYVVEVSVAGRPDPATGRVIDLPRLQGEVRRRVIDRFDHKHLNLDCPEFSTLNPTVEHIAVVIWRLLENAFEGTARLAKIRVWETPKTSAEYTGEPRN